MHTVEVTSSEATNTFDPTFWYPNTHTRTPEQEYIYGTVKHSGWPLHSEKGYHRESELDQESDLIYESTNLLPEKSIGEERKQIYGTVSHHRLEDTSCDSIFPFLKLYCSILYRVLYNFLQTVN